MVDLPEIILVSPHTTFAPGGPTAAEPSHIVVLTTTLKVLQGMTKLTGVPYLRGDLYGMVANDTVGAASAADMSFADMLEAEVKSAGALESINTALRAQVRSLEGRLWSMKDALTRAERALEAALEEKAPT